MDKRQKIKEIYYCISPERKDMVRKELSDMYGISVDSVKINWIYNGGIPQDKVEEVLKVVRKHAKAQANQLLDII